MRGPMVSGVIDQLLTTTEWYVVALNKSQNLCSRNTNERSLIILLFQTFVGFSSTAVHISTFPYKLLYD